MHSRFWRVSSRERNYSLSLFVRQYIFFQRISAETHNKCPGTEAELEDTDLDDAEAT